jgi:hypothetical protein
MLRSMSALMFLFCLTASCFAESSAVIGAGTATCAQYAESYKRSPSNVDAVFMSWAQGLLSGWTMSLLANGDHTTKNLSSKTPEQMAQHIHAYCDANPLKPFFLAAVDFHESLPEKKR